MNKLLTIVVAIFALFAMTAPAMADEEIVAHADINTNGNWIYADGYTETDHTTVDVDIDAKTGSVALGVGSSVTEDTMTSFANADVSALKADLETDVDASGHDAGAYADIDGVTMKDGTMKLDAVAIRGDIEFSDGHGGTYTENGLYAGAEVTATGDDVKLSVSRLDADAMAEVDHDDEASVYAYVNDDAIHGFLESIAQVLFGNNED